MISSVFFLLFLMRCFFDLVYASRIFFLNCSLSCVNFYESLQILFSLPFFIHHKYVVCCFDVIVVFPYTCTFYDVFYISNSSSTKNLFLKFFCWNFVTSYFFLCVSALCFSFYIYILK